MIMACDRSQLSRRRPRWNGTYHRHHAPHLHARTRSVYVVSTAVYSTSAKTTVHRSIDDTLLFFHRLNLKNKDGSNFSVSDRFLLAADDNNRITTTITNLI
jgi:hypothetical protein